MSVSSPAQKPTWVQVVKEYQRPRMSASVMQILTSLVPYLLLWPLMVWSLNISYLLTLPLTVLASGFLIRTFIIQHDCGHGSFFRDKRWNTLVGNMCSFFSLTPYDYWRTSHAIHHAHNGDLNHRGTGDIFTMTLREYADLDRRGRFMYRLYRSPLVLFTVGAAINFLILQRSPIALRTARNEAGRKSIIRTDIAITIIFLLTVLVIGLKAFLMIYLPVMWLTATLGVWLFYVQHQFEDVYWSKDPNWTYSDAALKGSTYFRLPKVLQWFTGNIGLHHIHHLSPLIPNYELQRCHDENPEFQTVVTITLWDAIRIVVRQFGLWDEEQGKLLTFREAKSRLAEIEA